jgi:hypothetical protein
MEWGTHARTQVMMGRKEHQDTLVEASSDGCMLCYSRTGEQKIFSCLNPPFRYTKNVSDLKRRKRSLVVNHILLEYNEDLSIINHSAQRMWQEFSLTDAPLRLPKAWGSISGLRVCCVFGYSLPHYLQPAVCDS